MVLGYEKISKTRQATSKLKNSNHREKTEFYQELALAPFVPALTQLLLEAFSGILMLAVLVQTPREALIMV